MYDSVPSRRPDLVFDRRTPSLLTQPRTGLSRTVNLQPERPKRRHQIWLRRVHFQQLPAIRKYQLRRLRRSSDLDDTT